MTHFLRVLPLHLGEAAVGKFDMVLTTKLLIIMCVPELVRADFASRVHRTRGLPLELNGDGMTLTACAHVRVRALRMSRLRVARYADECNPDRAWVLRDLLTGAFDVQVIVPTTERLGGLEHLNPLLGHVQGHVLGRILEGALVTESISQHPDVLASEGEVTRQVD